MYVAFENDYELLIGCDNKELREAMQETMDGRKIRMQNQIIIPIKSSPKIFRFQKQNIDFGSNVKDKIIQIAQNIKDRKRNIQIIKEDYNKTFFYFTFLNFFIYSPEI